MAFTPHPDPLPQGERERFGENHESVTPGSVTDSPWFWVMLFSLAGLAALFTVAPKFERREATIEEKFHASERALGREAFDKPADDAALSAAEPQSRWKPIFTLTPIAVVLAGVAVVAMINVLRFQRRRLAMLYRKSDNEEFGSRGD